MQISGRVLSVVSDSDNNLLIEFSTKSEAGYFLELSPWQENGISCVVYRNSEAEAYNLHELSDVYFSHITARPEAQKWISTFPEGVAEKLTEFVNKYENVFPVLLHCISCSRYALELFKSTPVLVWLVLSTAKFKGWDIDFVLHLISQKRTTILKECGLHSSKAVLKLVNKLSFSHYTHFEYELILGFQWSEAAKYLNHAGVLDKNLVKYLLSKPALMRAKFFRQYEKSFDWHDFKMLITDTIRMADLVGNDEVKKDIFECSSINCLIRLHDKLAYEVNVLNYREVEFGDTSEPPIPSTKDIVFISNSGELNIEGVSMKHCVFSYQEKLQSGQYYVYRLLKPERATVGIERVACNSFVIDQIKLKCNQQPSDETIRLVYEWFNKSVD